jgi:hypothetical protein
MRDSGERVRALELDLWQKRKIFPGTFDLKAMNKKTIL